MSPCIKHPLTPGYFQWDRDKKKRGIKARKYGILIINWGSRPGVAEGVPSSYFILVIEFATVPGYNT